MNDDASNRVFGLDLVRAFAAILVLLCHLDPWFAAYLHFGAWPPAIRGGIVGVELFFVLSGYLVGRILITEAHALESAAWHTFMIRRWLRTLPLYYVCLLTLAIIFPPYSWYWRHDRELTTVIPVFAFFMQNFAWHIGFDNWFRVSWSITVEEWFYLLFSLILLLSRRPEYRMKWLFWLLAICFIVPIYIRYEWHLPGGVPDSVVTALDQIAIGVALGWTSLRHPLQFRKLAWLLPVGFVLFATFWAAPELLKLGGSSLWNAFSIDVLGISMACCLPAAARWHSANGHAANLVRAVSTCSYGLYLIHDSVLEIVGYYKGVYGFSGLSAVVIASGLIVLLPSLAWQLVEKPALRLRHLVARPISP